MEEARPISDVERAEQDARDVVAVLSLLDRHPIAEDNRMLLVDQFSQLTRSAAFREWFSRNVLDTTMEGLVKNLMLHERKKDSMSAARNLCSCSGSFQLFLAQQAMPRLLKESPRDRLVAQVLCNCVTGNAKSAQIFVECAHVEWASEASSQWVLLAAMYNAYKVLLLLQEGGEELVKKIVSIMVAALEARRGKVCESEARVWISSCAHASQWSLDQLNDVGGLECVQLAMKSFPSHYVWYQNVAWASKCDMEWLAGVCADESPEARHACLVLCRDHSMVDVCISMLKSQESEEVCHALQLLGNCVYRNDVWITQRLLQLDALCDVLKWTRFDPKARLSREWAMLVLRNATEVDPAVHEYLSKLRALEVDRSAPETQDLEKRIGGKLVLSESGQIFVERKL